MFKIFSYGFVLLLSFVLISCNEALQPEPSQLGYEYFPLTSGDYRIYDVTSILYKPNQPKDSTTYQLKELIGISDFTEGHESFRVERYIRLNENEDWVIDSVWSARINTHQAIMVENNSAIIKLSFPISEDRRWDGNAMNAKEYDEFKMLNLGAPSEINGLSFDKTILLEKDSLIPDIKIVEDRLNIELFASGVGMIYREDLFLDYCDPSDCDSPGIILEGYIKRYALIDYSVSD